MTEILKGKGLAGLIVILICIALVTAGCSGADNAAMAGDAETNEAEETVTEDTEETEETPAAEPGVYAELKQVNNKIEITPVPGGITDSTVLPTFRCTFGEMTDEAQKALEEGRTFPKEFFRDLTACMLISEAQMEGKEHDAIMYSLSTLAGLANEFWSMDPVLKSVEYEAGDDGSIAKSIYNVHFGSAGTEGKIVYDNQARKWYLGDAEYTGSIDSEETLAMWWTVFEIANGDNQDSVN